VYDPGGRRFTTKVDGEVSRTSPKANPHAYWFAILFPNSFMGVAKPLPQGTWVAEWTERVEVSERPVARHPFRIRNGRVIGGTPPPAMEGGVVVERPELWTHDHHDS
jgi:hypothetical protein